MRSERTFFRWQSFGPLISLFGPDTILVTLREFLVSVLVLVESSIVALAQRGAVVHQGQHALGMLLVGGMMPHARPIRQRSYRHALVAHI